MKICAVVTRKDFKMVELANSADLIEIRMDTIGKGWEEVVRKCKKPWIATNRTKKEGGEWRRNEEERINKLFEAIRLGASIIDIELSTKNLEKIVRKIKREGVKCIISSHLDYTPSLEKLRKFVREEIKSGADICKIVTTAKKLEDNLINLQLIKEFCKKVQIVSFSMGQLGVLSRVLSPLVGGVFTYAHVGEKSAEGQINLESLRKIYELFRIEQ
jgi:3-dehydroquinate dehydratase type I